MRKITTTMMLVAGIALMAAPAPAQVGEPVRERPAQERGMRAGGPAAMAQNPAAMILARAEEIGLTADQVRQIEAIQARVEQENAPRVAQLRAVAEDLRAMTAEERRQARVRMQEMQPIREQIQATNRAAGAEIHGLLTAAQEARVHALRQARAAEARRRGLERRPAAGQQRPSARQQRPALRQGRPGVRGPRGGMDQIRPGAAVQSPGAMLLEHQAHIGLTDDQVRQIETIQARVEAANAPRIEQLRGVAQDMRAMSVEERRQLRERMQELRGTREQIRQTNRAAGEEIHALLTPEQQARVRTLRRAQAGELRPRGPEGRDGMW